MSLRDRARTDPGLACVVLSILSVVALYASTVGRGIVNFDDPWLYRDNWVLQDLTWSTLRAVWLELDSPARYALSPEYLPVRDMSVMLDFQLWGGWYGGFHLTNVLLYVLAIVVWFAALVELGVERATAGLAILIWAVHPSHAESVAWLSERKGLLGALFSGTCALAYARCRAGRSVAWLALALVAAVLAVWSKALAAFTVAALAPLELVLPGRASWRRSLVGLGALGLVGGLAFIPVVLLAAQANVVGIDVVAPAGRAEMVAGVAGFYLRMGAMLAPNAISYPLSALGPSVLDVVVGIVGLAALVGLAAAPGIGTWRPTPELRAGACVWLVTWFPVSHLVLGLQMVYVADRYQLMPTLGIALIAAALLRRISRDRARVALIAVVVLAAALRTLDAQSNWRDDLTLWERATVSNPRDPKAWSAYAYTLSELGADDLAWEAIERGLTYAPSPNLLLRKAVMLELRGERDAAFATMREAAEGGELRAMSNLALLLHDRGETAEALAWARRSTAGAPLAPRFRAHGKIALAAGQLPEALAAFRAAYAYEPTVPANRYNLALALIGLHRAQEAIPHLLACANAPATAADCRRELSKFQRVEP